VSRGRFSQFIIDGRSVAAVGLDPSSFVPILKGRAPLRDDEVVLGETTMEQAHLHIGDSAPIRVQQQTRPFRVVGTAVFPRLAPYPASEPTGLGIGAATTVNAIGTDGMLGNPFYLVRLRRGAHLTVAQLGKTLGADAPKFDSVLSAQRPNDVLSWGHISDTSLALAAVLVLLAVGSALHLLVTSVRSRRRDLALLKTVGFTRRQVVESVLAQATILVGIALVVAVPLGVLAGRWLWTLTARWIGIADDPSIPYSVIAIVVVAAIAIGNAIALGPGANAARTRPALVLRSE
jgi:hypothetical protein